MTDPTNPIFVPEIAHVLGHARAVVGMAKRHKWPVPPTWAAATGVLAAAEAAATPAPASPPTWPTDPTEVAGFVRTVAAERAAVAGARAVGAEVAAHARIAAIHAAREAAPDYLGRLCVDFDKLAARFGQLADTAPRTLSGHETAAALADHAELLRTAAALTQAALDRGALALLSQEASDLGRTGLTWLLIDVPADSGISILAVTAAVRELAGEAPTDVAGWARLSRIGLRMAGPGEAQARLETYGAVLRAHGHSPSGGRADALWSELLAGLAEQAADPEPRRSGRVVVGR